MREDLIYAILAKNWSIQCHAARVAALNNAKGSYAKYTVFHFDVLLCYFYYYTGFT